VKETPVTVDPENVGKVRCDAFHDALDGRGGYVKTQCVRVDRHRGDHVYRDPAVWLFSGHPMDHPDLFEEVDGEWRPRKTT
jgi:hypothetical protein